MKLFITTIALLLANLTWAQPSPSDQRYHCVIGFVAAKYPGITIQGYCQDNKPGDTPESELYTKAQCEALRDPIINALIDKYGQHDIGQHSYVPEYGYAQEIYNDTLGDPPTTKDEFLETKARESWNQTAWLTFMHAQMATALKQAKEKGDYPECTLGEKFLTNENRICLEEQLNVCQFAWKGSVFKWDNGTNSPRWD